MRSRIGSFCMALGAVLLAAAIALLAYNTWDNWRAGQSVAETADALDAMIQDDTTRAEDDSTAGDAMPVVEIDGYYYIGTLSIPSLGLELPIMYEWSYPGLRIAPGRYSGAVSSGDLIICGHNYERHFGNLKYLESGAEIVFTDVTGNAFCYEVSEIVTLQPTAVDELLSQENGEWNLTLVTCTIGGQTRVTVRCVRTDG